MKKMIYLDNAATTKTAPEVVEAMLPYFSEFYGNPSSIYDLAGQSKEAVTKAREQIAEVLNVVLKQDQTTTLLLEKMAGKGSEVGSSFEELASIIEKVDLKDKVGICLDTCHVWDAGYDIVNDLEGVLEEFDAVLGLEKLRALHINDSLNPRGSRKDRHARIGEGKIGSDALVRVVLHPKLKGLPCILETPNELSGYKKEIAFFYACERESL